MSEQPENEGGADNRLASDGEMSYLHIPADDVREAAAFYRDVFGWTIHNPDSDRPGFETPDGRLGGAWMSEGQEVVRDPGLLPYIYVDHVEETVARIIAHKGEIVTEPYPEGLLTVGTFRDPAGNQLGIWHDTNRD
jgi:predicted enzyme related to lactoylglutathione lyase